VPPSLISFTLLHREAECSTVALRKGLSSKSSKAAEPALTAQGAFSIGTIAIGVPSIFEAGSALFEANQPAHGLRQIAMSSLQTRRDLPANTVVVACALVYRCRFMRLTVMQVIHIASEYRGVLTESPLKLPNSLTFSRSIF